MVLKFDNQTENFLVFECIQILDRDCINEHNIITNAVSDHLNSGTIQMVIFWHN
jgi:hypothetical protein